MVIFPRSVYQSAEASFNHFHSFLFYVTPLYMTPSARSLPLFRMSSLGYHWGTLLLHLSRHFIMWPANLYLRLLICSICGFCFISDDKIFQFFRLSDIYHAPLHTAYWQVASVFSISWFNTHYWHTYVGTGNMQVENSSVSAIGDPPV